MKALLAPTILFFVLMFWHMAVGTENQNKK